MEEGRKKRMNRRVGEERGKGWMGKEGGEEGGGGRG